MRKKLLFIAIAGGLVINSSCVNLKKLQTYPAVEAEVTGRYITDNGETLDIDLVVRVPAEYTSRHTGIKVCPAIVSGAAETRLPPMVIDGKTYERFNERMEKFTPSRADGVEARVNYAKDASVAEYHATADRSAWKPGSALYADIYGSAYTRSIHLGRIRVDGGVFDLSGFVHFTPIEKYYFGDPLESRVIRGGVSGHKESLSRFAAGSSQMQSDETLSKYIEEMFSDPLLRDYNVSVVVSNSPEGSLESNRDLGDAREASIRDFLTSLGIDKGKITFTMYEEGWEELLDILPSLGLKDPSAIREIIRTTPDIDERERNIRRSHPADYRTMLDEAYPSLRYGKTTITTEYQGVLGRTYSYMVNYPYGYPDSFSVSEAEPIDLREINMRLLDSVRADNIAGAVRLAARMTAPSLPEFIHSNKGMVLLRADRTDEALAHFLKAPSIPEARYNAGLLLLRGRDYAAAANALTPYSDQNAAVAYLYTGQNGQAAETLLLLPKSAERDYLLALAYVRTGEHELAVKFLSEATAQAPALRRRASCEPDFRPILQKAGLQIEH